MEFFFLFICRQQRGGAADTNLGTNFIGTNVFIRIRQYQIINSANWKSVEQVDGFGQGS